VLPTELKGPVERLSDQDKERILANVLWDVFGDVDEDGKPCLVPGRKPDRVDIGSLVAGLRQEFFPETVPSLEESCPLT
jgi:hypothetical protein